MLKKANIILFGFSVVFSLYAFELGSYITKQLYYSEHSPATIKRISTALKQGQAFDTRTRLQYIIDNEEAGVALSPRITPSQFNKLNGLKTDDGRLFPLGGLSRRRTVYCNNYGDYLLFESDQWGFRNPPNIATQKPMDLMVVGDSFSMGHCIDNDIASFLRAPDVSSMSVAYSGNGPIIELATIREYVTQHSPKVVLWVYYEGNDLSGLNAEKKSNLLMRYLDPSFSQKLVDRQPEIDRLLDAFVVKTRAREIEKRSGATVAKLTGVRVLLKKSIKRVLAKSNRQSKADLSLFKQVLTQAENEVAAWGGQMVFVYLPDWVRFAYPDNYGSLNHWLDYRGDVLAIVQELGMPTVDIAESMSLAETPVSYYPYGRRGHFTEEGYEHVVEQISQTLSEKGLLSQ